ncbi:MAG: hypothetical protein RBU30_21205 [Polyangia bacterium]|nr:hypothetical protein [Polyangia bacterium]
MAWTALSAGCGDDASHPRFNRDDHDPVHGWILLDGDRAQVSANLSRAAEFGVTQVQLSHDLIMEIDEITQDEGRAALLQDIAQEARGLGLEVLVWAHELTGNRMQVCFHGEDPLWEERRETYRQAFDRIPELDGLVLMFGSSAPDPWFAFCQCPDPATHAEVCVPEDPEGPIPELEAPPPAERVRLVTETVADVTEALGKQLFVRTFIHSPEQLSWVGEGLRLAAHRDFTVMSKDVPQDFQPFYPHDPLIGSIGLRPHVAELDLAGEYWGQAQILNPQVDLLVYRFRHLWEHQGIGTVSRIERGGRHLLGTPSEVNAFAVSALMAAPSSHPDLLFDAWIEERYGLSRGTEAAEGLKRVFRLSWESTRKRHYVLGFWALEKDSELPPEIRTEQLAVRNTAKYDGGFDALFAELQSPSQGTLRAIFQEGHEALGAALAAEDIFASEVDAALRSTGASEDASDLARRLRHQSLAAEAWLWAEEALWGDKLLRSSASPDPLARSHLEQALTALEALGARIQAELGPGGPFDLGRPIWPAAPSRIAELVAAFRARYPLDSAPPPQPRTQLLIGLPRVTDLEAGSARVTFDTTAPARCDLEWGTVITHTPSLVPGDGLPGTAHSFLLTGLTPDALHLVRTRCTPEEPALDAGDLLVGGDFYLWTPSLE